MYTAFEVGEWLRRMEREREQGYHGGQMQAVVMWLASREMERIEAQRKPTAEDE